MSLTADKAHLKEAGDGLPVTPGQFSKDDILEDSFLMTIDRMHAIKIASKREERIWDTVTTKVESTEARLNEAITSEKATVDFRIQNEKLEEMAFFSILTSREKCTIISA
jgi:hypothetical protein